MHRFILIGIALRHTGQLPVFALLHQLDSGIKVLNIAAAAAATPSIYPARSLRHLQVIGAAGQGCLVPARARYPTRGRHNSDPAMRRPVLVPSRGVPVFCWRDLSDFPRSAF
ncbi:hypothetical protein E2C01_074508 [Portunus trituberculatus]|uniref:Uncharacterized protein n=1 Tax=Portunus trituberculatus TaxID=210409 RepID=A0A5B7IGG1_PORTR|nr:hypothetical protein [Portunus trituberculatus]